MRSEREARFTLLVKAHQESLWRYLRILGSDEETAADLLQETFLSVWRKPPEERNPHSTRAYLRRVARNLFLMSIRKSRIKTSLADMDQVSVADAEFDRFSADDGESYRQALRQCLEDLSPRARRALHLQYREAASRQQIAVDLGIGLNGVKALMRRSRNALRACIDRTLALSGERR